MSTSFADLGVPADLVQALEREGIAAPFEVQVASIPDAIAGRDVLGRAPTGSGKTLAFGIPLVAQLAKAKPRRPKALVLSPTRELAEQIRRALEPLARVRKRSVLSIYGGVGFGAQRTGLKNGADLIVACPGRLIDLIEQNELSLDQVEYVVVDEADRMADMGFLPAVKKLLDLTAQERQTVLFSATLDKEVQVLIDRYQSDPVTHQVGEVEPDLSLVTHTFYKTKAEEKLALAADTIDNAGPTVIFCRTRHGVDRVARQLKSAGIKSGWIHGGRSQSQRDAALQAFTSGKVQALVATDVAARGIHVDGVRCVIHFDPPAEYKDYVHRSGRTARAGNDGVVVSFINSDQVKSAKKMMRDVGLPQTEIHAAPDTSERAAHIQIELRSRRAQNEKNQKGKGAAGKGGRGEKRPERGNRSAAPERASQDWRTRGDSSTSETRADGDKRGGRTDSRDAKRTPRQENPRSDRAARSESAKNAKSEDSMGGRRAPDVAKAEDREWSVTNTRPKKSGPKKPRHRDRDATPRADRGDRAERPERTAADSESSGTGSRKAGMPKRLRNDGTAQPKRAHRSGGKPGAKAGKGGPKSGPKRSGKPRPKNKRS